MARLEECFALGQEIAFLDSKPVLDCGRAVVAINRQAELTAALGAAGIQALYDGYRAWWMDCAKK